MAKTTWKHNIALLIGALLMSLILLEIGLRTAGGILIYLRDRDNRLHLKETGEFRILCVGESTTWCGGLSYAYPRLLEEVLNKKSRNVKFSVINKGKPGCSTAYIVDNLRGWIEEISPQMVIAMMGINDTAVSHRLHDEPGPWAKLFSNLRVYKLFSLLFRHGREKMKDAGFVFRQDPENDLNIYKGYLGERYDRFGEVSEAELLQKIKNEPGNTRARVALGKYYIAYNRYDKAAEIFQKILEDDPKNDAAHVGLARYHLNAHNHSGVKRHIHRALKSNPENDEAYTVLGLSEMSKKKYDDAFQHLEKAVELNPKNARAMGALAWICFWKLEHYDQGEETARRALEINPAEYFANVTLWCLYQKEGDLEAAVEVCKKAIEADPYNQRAYIRLGVLYNELGQPELAEEYFQKDQSLRMNTYNPITRDSYQKMIRLLKEERIPLVAVQYPVRSAEPLKRMLTPPGNVILVDNEQVYKNALAEKNYSDLFKDRFAGDFGHCTEEGNYLLASNIADVLFQEYFIPKLGINPVTP